MTDDDATQPKPVSVATQERRDKRTKSQLRQKKLLKRMIYAAYAVLIGLIALGAYDRFFSWDVQDHTSEYFGKADFVGQHTGDPVLYEQIPPTGGPHARVPQACGFYSQFVHNENAVHSLEHGAVWIAYDPDISSSDLEKLRELGTQPYVLVSPYPGMTDKITVSSWGHQMKLDKVELKRIDAFRSTYGNNQKYSPEFGAPCGPTFTEVTDIVPQQVRFVCEDPDGPALGGISASNATATAEADGSDPPATPIASPAATPVASPSTSG